MRLPLATFCRAFGANLNPLLQTLLTSPHPVLSILNHQEGNQAGKDQESNAKTFHSAIVRPEGVECNRVIAEVRLQIAEVKEPT